MLSTTFELYSIVSPRTIAFVTCAAVTFLGMKPKSGSLAAAAAVELLPADGAAPRWWGGKCWRYGLSAMSTRNHDGKNRELNSIIQSQNFLFLTWSAQVLLKPRTLINVNSSVIILERNLCKYVERRCLVSRKVLDLPVIDITPVFIKV